MDTENKHSNLMPKTNLLCSYYARVIPFVLHSAREKQYALLLYIHTEASASCNVLVSQILPWCPVFPHRFHGYSGQGTPSVPPTHIHLIFYVALWCWYEPLWCKYTGRYRLFCLPASIARIGVGFKLSLSIYSSTEWSIPILAA